MSPQGVAATSSPRRYRGPLSRPRRRNTPWRELFPPRSSDNRRATITAHGHRSARAAATRAADRIRLANSGPRCACPTASATARRVDEVECVEPMSCRVAQRLSRNQAQRARRAALDKWANACFRDRPLRGRRPSSGTRTTCTLQGAFAVTVVATDRHRRAPSLVAGRRRRWSRFCAARIRPACRRGRSPPDVNSRAAWSARQRFAPSFREAHVMLHDRVPFPCRAVRGPAEITDNADPPELGAERQDLLRDAALLGNGAVLGVQVSTASIITGAPGRAPRNGADATHVPRTPPAPAPGQKSVLRTLRGARGERHCPGLHR